MGQTFSVDEDPTEVEVEAFAELRGYYEECRSLAPDARPSDKEMLAQLKYGWVAGTSDEEPTKPMGMEELESQLAEERRAREEAERIYKEHILGLKEKLIPSLRRVKVVEEQLVAERQETFKVEQDLVKEIKERKMSDLVYKNRIANLEARLFKATKELEDMRLRMETLEDEIVQRAKVAREQAVAATRRRWMGALRVAELSLFEERKEKLVLQGWLQRFETDGFEEPALDHAESAMSKFAQSVAYAPIVQPIDFKQMVASGVMEFLIKVCHPHNKQKVLGPAALALSHLSRDDASKREVAAMGGVKSLLLLLQVIDREPVLTQVCRTLASVALVDAVKVQIAAQGGVRTLCRMVSYVEDEELNRYCTMRSAAAQIAALHALVNVTYANDANRTALAAAGGIPHICQLMHETEEPEVLMQGSRLLGNLAYNHPANQALIASAEGDDALARGCRPEFAPEVQRAAATALANLVHSERNQAQVGSGPVPEALIGLLDSTDDLGCRHAAAMAIGSMVYLSFLNKGRMVEKGAHRPLVRLAAAENGGHAPTRIMIFQALATISLTETNQRALAEEDVLGPLVRFCNASDDAPLLEAAAMALAANAPDVVTRERFEAEGRLLPFVVVGGLDALLRVQSVVYADESPPPWLANVVEVLTVASVADYSEKARRFSEVFPRWFLAKDAFSEVEKEGDHGPPVEFEFSGEGGAEEEEGGEAAAAAAAAAAGSAGPARGAARPET